MSQLHKPVEEDIRELRDRLHPSRVLFGPETCERYARDESTRLYNLPCAVAIVENNEQVSTVLRWASEGGFGVVVRGAGTGVAGGAVPIAGEVVLSLEKLDRIIEIDEENLTATCQPGVITADLQEEVERRGLFYPPDPASADVSTIGGNVAVGAGGARAVKYGVTRDYVTGMTVVLADGEIVEMGGKNVKDATGYHLMQLMMGSEGTLGVITSVTVRLLPLPTRQTSLLVSFPDIEQAALSVSEIIRRRIIPAAAEFIDEVAIEAASKHLGRDLPSQEKAGAYVFILLDGESGEELQLQMEQISEIVEANGALDVLGAEDRGQQARLWESRKVVGDAMKGLSPQIGKADVVVPRGHVATLVKEVKKLALELDLSIACFGHAGDGNVHVNILRRTLGDEEWDNLLPLAFAGVMAIVKRLGGRPSGEHGIGVLKKDELVDFVGTRAHEIMKGVRKVFDPKGILNPGKVT